ncbi:phospholipase A2 inhibitor [Ctenocephalides felis]|uniref:phospholipase A2 inhibitor n=1 Tax=Ctenocephalides felis TaxID=7515 RepID=UPI000E6E36F4|nr:phospholipase A2 inhibitor [Ctenocephalides felis]XP_026474197.1 phospholipase A2 inhibitor [Ctenocephalides felis]
MARFIRLVLLLISLYEASALDGGCGKLFNGKCICGLTTYGDREQYVVNCTNTGFEDTKVLENLPEATEVLIFTGNNIPELPWNVFGALTELEHLRIVDMSNNRIKDIPGKAYHHVKNVQRLILNHNDLSISPDSDEDNHHHPRVFSNFINLMELHLTNAFADNTDAELANDLHNIFVNSNLTHLRKLHLEQNEILNFGDKRVFCDLPSLRDLHLGDNYLSEIDFNFLCLKNLRFLDLERNKIEYFKKRDLLTLDQVNAAGREEQLVIDVGGNPFRCDCIVSEFYSWLFRTNVTVRNKESLRCHRAQKHGGEALISLSVDKCRKAQSVVHDTSKISTVTFMLIILIVILSGLVVALGYMSRDKLKLAFTPVIETVSKKVQYTTIRNNEQEV